MMITNDPEQLIPMIPMIPMISMNLMLSTKWPNDQMTKNPLKSNDPEPVPIVAQKAINPLATSAVPADCPMRVLLRISRLSYLHQPLRLAGRPRWFSCEDRRPLRYAHLRLETRPLFRQTEKRMGHVHLLSAGHSPLQTEFGLRSGRRFRRRFDCWWVFNENFSMNILIVWLAIY